MSTYWASEGHDVTVVTAARHYMLLDDSADRGGASTSPEYDKLRIVEVYASQGRRRSIARRVLNYLTFAWSVLAAGWRAGPADVVYCRTPPILLNAIGWVLARTKGARYVLEIGDLHPDEAVALGLIRSKLLIAVWDAWERFFRRRADLIVAVVPGIRTMLLAKGEPDAKIHVATNGFDPVTEVTSFDELREDARRLCELSDQTFVIGYTGSMGKAIALDTVVDAAKKLQDCCPEALVVFVGDGDEKPRLQRRCRVENVTNVEFLDPVPLSHLQHVYRRCNVLVHSVYAGDFHGYNLPNKIFSYLGAGKPLLFAGTGTIAEVIAGGRCGIVVPPETPTQLAEAAAWMHAHPAESDAMGSRALEFVKREFNRKKILDDLTQRLDRLAVGA